MKKIHALLYPQNRHFQERRKFRRLLAVGFQIPVLRVENLHSYAVENFNAFLSRVKNSRL